MVDGWRESPDEEINHLKKMFTENRSCHLKSRGPSSKTQKLPSYATTRGLRRLPKSDICLNRWKIIWVKNFKGYTECPVSATWKHIIDLKSHLHRGKGKKEHRSIDIKGLRDQTPAQKLRTPSILIDFPKQFAASRPLARARIRTQAVSIQDEIQ